MKKTMLPRLRKILVATACLLCLYTQSVAQAPPFYNDIQHFKKQDSIDFPPKFAILFAGSSSFTQWVDVQDYFPGYNILNRGFGGSSLVDLIRYSDDIIFRYEPKQIILYCGENDLAASDTVTAEIVFERFKQLFQIIRNRMPRVPVAYISMKPSPSREKLLPEMIKGNALIKNYLKTKEGTAYIDVYHKMFDREGKIRSDIFKGDKLHMNAKGYAIWKEVIGPYLVH